MSLQKIEIVNDHGHGKATEVRVDGVPITGLRRAEIVFDVMDVVRMTLSSFVRGSIITEGHVDSDFKARVILDHGPSYEILGEASGPTAKAAMQAAVDAMEEPA